MRTQDYVHASHAPQWPSSLPSDTWALFAHVPMRSPPAPQLNPHPPSHTHNTIPNHSYPCVLGRRQLRFLHPVANGRDPG